MNVYCVSVCLFVLFAFASVYLRLLVVTEFSCFGRCLLAVACACACLLSLVFASEFATADAPDTSRNTILPPQVFLTHQNII